MNQVFLGWVEHCCGVESGVDVCSVSLGMGSGTLRSGILIFGGDSSTFRSASSSMGAVGDGVGESSIVFYCCAMSAKVLQIELPAWRLGVVGQGGCANEWMMSSTACFGWSCEVTCGNGNKCWKKVIVSHVLVVHVHRK